MIKIEDLEKDYGTTRALKGLSFEVPRGQVVGFLGPNGAGKSTTMKILTGYLHATKGRAQVAGIDVADAPVEARRIIGYLPESNPLYEEMMVREFLDFAADVRRIDRSARQGVIKNAVDRCGLGDVITKDIGQLSKGFRQRVGLAQAILHDPDLLILDEPTSGLDPNQIVEIRELIKELGQEKTVIMSTHILSEVQSTADRVLIINDGELVADDSPDNLTSSEGGTLFVMVAPKNGVTGVEDSEDEGGGTAGFALKYAAEDPRRGVFEAVVENDLILIELRRKHVSLEETFRRLTSSPGQGQG
jgi:ABC-2 type transport system ATP-binding protein